MNVDKIEKSHQISMMLVSVKILHFVTRIISWRILESYWLEIRITINVSKSIKQKMEGKVGEKNGEGEGVSMSV